jgi:tRNA pseudouridine65 synthase
MEILFQDEHFIAIHKPPGLAVHRSEVVRERRTALALVRNELDQWVYPVHRLDRATSGILVFAKSSEACSVLAESFAERRVKKTYEAVVRGWMPEPEGCIDLPLAEDGRTALPSQTNYRVLAQSEVDWAVSPRHATTRYSWLELDPKTGRFHQIRKHLVKVAHPIVGDRQHGDRTHNRFAREVLKCSRMLLAATRLSFKHPYTGEEVRLERQPSFAFRKTLYQLWLRKAEGAEGPQRLRVHLADTDSTDATHTTHSMPSTNPTGRDVTTAPTGRDVTTAPTGRDDTTDPTDRGDTTDPTDRGDTTDPTDPTRPNDTTVTPQTSARPLAAMPARQVSAELLS